jgi:amino acid adenylation domain-containing protein
LKAAAQPLPFDGHLAVERRFWLDRLRHLPARTAVPSGGGSISRAPAPVRLDGAVRRRLERSTSGSPFLLYTYLVAAAVAYLARGRDDEPVAVASPAPAATGVSNALTVACAAPSDLRFAELLERIRRELLAVYDRHLYPFDRLRAEVGGHLPFACAFRLDGLHGPMPDAGQAATFDFTAGGDAIEGRVRLAPGADPVPWHRFARAFAHLLRAAAIEPARPLAELPVLPPAERHRIRVELNDTAVEAPREGVHQLVHAAARRDLDRPAVVSGDRSWTFRELVQRSGRFADELRRRGAGPEARVAVMLERSPAAVVALLAVLETGAAYLPIDPRQPAAWRREQIAAAGAALAVTADRSDAGVPPGVPGIEAPPGGDDGPPAGTPGEPAEVAPEQLAYVLFTSGSSGRPKGVMVSHGAVASYLRWAGSAYRIADGAGAPVHSPLGFDLTVTSLWGPLAAGRPAVLLPADDAVRRLASALESAAEPYSLVKLTPAHLEALAARLPAPAAARAAGHLVVGGAALTGAHLRWWRRTAPATELVNEYGPTEATVGCIVYRTPCGEAPEGAVPIGRPIAGARIHLLDRAGAPVPTGVAGEITVAGAGLARGYLGRPAATAERFVPDPFDERGGGRLYRTGDLGRWHPAGRLECLGRVDRQLKVAGHRVEPGEIEVALCRHPGVAAAVVIGTGEDAADRRLIGYYAAAGDGAPEERELQDHLGDRLPGYMVPVRLLRLDELPLTANGKIDLAALPAPPAAAPPRTGAGELAELVAGIWCELLGLEAVAPADGFFALGGNSLVATRLGARTAAVLGAEVPMDLVFDEPTFGGYLRRIEEALAAGAPDGPEPAPGGRGDERSGLSAGQEHLWFLDQLRPGTAAFNIPSALRIEGPLDAASLRLALERLVERHEPLRTVYPAREGSPTATPAPGPAALPRIDLSRLGRDPSRDRETVRAEASRVAASIAGRGFDLARGPLWRAALIESSPTEHLFVLILHHIVGDGWSTGVLVQELCVLYEALAAGRAPGLPAIPSGYHEVVSRRHQLAPERREALVSYWRRTLRDAPEETIFPPDRARPVRPSWRGALTEVALPPELSSRVNELSRRHRATQFMTLLAAFAATIADATGRHDLVIGTDLAGRRSVESERLVGFFVNQVPLRLDLSGDPTFAELIARVRGAALGAYRHQDLPFGRLVEALGLERRLARPPLFQTKLIFQNFPAGELRGGGLDLTPVPVDSGTAQLDFVLALRPAENGLTGWIDYAHDLYDRDTVHTVFARFRALLEAALSGPERRLSELGGPLARTASDEKERPMSPKSFSRFAKRPPKTLELPTPEQLVQTSPLCEDGALPLVLRPKIDDVDLAEWSAANRSFVEEELRRHGALLFRGFGIDTPETFERFAGAVADELFNENGEHPRDSVSGNVYTPVFYPPDRQLLWHNENSFNRSWPLKILFCCVHPAETGGETPLVDSRAVYRRIRPEVRDRFAERGVMYVRNYGEGIGLDWKTVFGTEDRSVVEEHCRRGRLGFEWKEGDRLRTTAVRPAVIDHPATAEPCWFTQAQHWHVSCLDPETRASITAVFEEHDYPRNCYYGDGAPIADEDMQHVLDVYRELEVAFPWHRGDVVLVDNVLTAHGRNPFSGQRKILVALGEMTWFDEADERAVDPPGKQAETTQETTR